MVQDSPSRHQDQFVLRLPDGMRDRIAREAKSNNRSMNAEIVARLDESLGSRVSDRLNWALREIAVDFGHEPLSPALLAEDIGEETASRAERIFSGAEEPTFEFLDRVAAYLAVNEAWLKRGTGQPFKVSLETNYNLELADKLLAKNAKKITFVRNDTLEGELAIVIQLDEFRCETLTTHIRLSDEIGASGEGDAARFSLVCRKLWRERSGLMSSILLKPTAFDDLISGKVHPRALFSRLHYSQWVDDWWDEAMFRERNAKDVYWPGYTAFCERISRAIEADDTLRSQRDAIIRGRS